LAGRRGDGWLLLHSLAWQERKESEREKDAGEGAARGSSSAGRSERGREETEWRKAQRRARRRLQAMGGREVCRAEDRMEQGARRRSGGRAAAGRLWQGLSPPSSVSCAQSAESEQLLRLSPPTLLLLRVASLRARRRVNGNGGSPLCPLLSCPLCVRD